MSAVRGQDGGREGWLSTPLRRERLEGLLAVYGIMVAAVQNAVNVLGCLQFLSRAADEPSQG